MGGGERAVWDLQSLLSVSEHALPCSSQGLRQLPAAPALSLSLLS
jgi:hypothetical protein